MPGTVQHVKNVTIADWSGVVTVGNSSGGSTTMQASDMARPSDWNSVHNVTQPGVSFFQPFPLHNTNSTLSSPGIGTWYLQPFDLPYDLSSGRINMFVSNAAGFLNGTTFSATSTGSMSKIQTLWNRLALYRLGTGANTTRLESVWTGEMELRITWSLSVNGTVSSALSVTNALTLSFPSQWDISGGMTFGSTSTSGSTSTAVSTAASSFANARITTVVQFVSGARMDIAALATNLPAGDYWLAHMFSSNSSSSGTRYTAGTIMSTQSRLGLLENDLMAYKRLGASVSNSTSTPVANHGFFATTTSAAPAFIATSDIRATTGRMYWNYLRSN